MKEKGMIYVMIFMAFGYYLSGSTAFGAGIHAPSVTPTVVSTSPVVSAPYVPSMPQGNIAFSDDKVPEFEEYFWLREYDGGSCTGQCGAPDVYDLAPIADGFYAVGSVMAGRSRAQIMVAQFSNRGDIKWVKLLDDGKSILAGSAIIPTPDGGSIVLGGFARKGDGIPVIRLDGNGNAQWIKHIPAHLELIVPPAAPAGLIAPDGQGGFVIVVVEEASRLQMKMIRMDMDGNVTWVKTLLPGNSVNSVRIDKSFFRLKALIPANGTGFYLVTKGWFDHVPLCRILVIKLSSTGDIIWQKSYVNGEGGWLEAQAACLANDGGLLIGSNFLSGSGFVIMKINDAGVPQWAFRADHGEIYDMVQSPINGQVIAVGDTIFSQLQFGALVMGINYKGILWQKLYAWEEDAHAYAVDYTVDGGFVIALSDLVEDPIRHHADDRGYIIKVDSDGEVDGCNSHMDTNITATSTDIATFGLDFVVSNDADLSITEPEFSGGTPDPYIAISCKHILTYPLTVEFRGGGRGKVTISSNDSWDESQECNSSCTNDFTYNATLTLHAQPALHSEFNGWGGGCERCGTNEACSLDLNEATSCTVEFLKQPNKPPVVDSLEASVYEGVTPLEVVFTCTAHDDDGMVMFYNWDLDGDGRVDLPHEGNRTATVLIQPGVYTISVYAVDDYGDVSLSPGSTTIRVFRTYQQLQQQGSQQNQTQGDNQDTQNTPQQQSANETSPSNHEQETAEGQPEGQGANETATQQQGQGGGEQQLEINQYIISFKAQVCDGHGNCQEGETFDDGDHLRLDLCVLHRPTDTGLEVDEYIAILTPDNSIFFLTQNPFSPLVQYTGGPITPSMAYKTGLSNLSGCSNVFEFDVSQELAGTYTIFAAFNTSGQELGVLTLKSNVASKELRFNQ